MTPTSLQCVYAPGQFSEPNPVTSGFNADTIYKTKNPINTPQRLSQKDRMIPNCQHHLSFVFLLDDESFNLHLLSSKSHRNRPPSPVVEPSATHAPYVLAPSAHYYYHHHHHHHHHQHQHQQQQ
jgi:hypothetical protein